MNANCVEYVWASAVIRVTPLYDAVGMGKMHIFRVIPTGTHGLEWAASMGVPRVALVGDVALSLLCFAAGIILHSHHPPAVMLIIFLCTCNVSFTTVGCLY